MVAALSFVLGILTLFSQTISWSWLAIGFVVLVVTTGMVAVSAIGAQVGTWFQAIGGVGRMIATIACVVVIWKISEILMIPTTPALSFFTGWMFAISTMIVIGLARSRKILE